MRGGTRGLGNERTKRNAVFRLGCSAVSGMLGHIVVAGASIAGMTAARELRDQGFSGKLTIIDRDVHAPYRRPEVSKGLLSGALDLGGVRVDWPDGLNANRLVGAKLTSLDLEERVVRGSIADGSFELPFDGLVIATGAASRPSPFGDGIGGVYSLRHYAESEAMRLDLAASERVVVIGGGFIGLEVAAVARKLGKTVTVLEVANLPLVTILGETFSRRVLENHRAQGVDMRLGVSVSGIEAGDNGRVRRVVLADGESIDADIVLVAVGSIPAIDWLTDSGLDVTNGLALDPTCAAEGVEGIVGAGDLASWVNPLYERRMRVEHWTNAIEQGVYAARRLLGKHDPNGFVSVPYFWSDQYGVRLQSIGSTFGHDEQVVLDDDPEHLLIAYLREGRLLAIVGMAAGASIFRFRSLVLAGVPAQAVLEQYAAVKEAAGRKLAARVS